MATGIAPAKRRAQQAAAPEGTGAAPTASAAATAPTTPVQAAAPVQQTLGVPASASVWTNPYPTTFTPAPIASPPANPNLTPMDISNQITEYSDWDRYLTGLGVNAANLSAQASIKVADIERNQAQGLDNNNWDTAARGLAQSSIRDNNATAINTDAASAKGSEIAGVTNANTMLAGEQAKWGTTAKPGIDAKYVFIGGENARKISENTPPAGPAAPAAPGPAGPAPVGSSPSTGHDSGPTKGQNVPPIGSTGNGVFMQDTGPRAGLRYIISNNTRRYESRPGAGDWGKGGNIGR